MKGFPVTPIAATSSRESASSIAVLSAARPLGPKVFGRVWSRPLSRVISAMRARAEGQVDVAELRLRHHLVAGHRDTAVEQRLELGSRGHQAAPSSVLSAAPFQCGFSQITVPPMPMPMHMVVMP